MYHKFMELCGRLAADPELVQGKKNDQQNGSSDDRVSGSICIQNVFRKDDKPEFFRYCAWGWSARLLADHAKKGKVVCLKGKPRSSSWEETITNEQGEKVTKTRSAVELTVAEVYLGEDAKGQQSGPVSQEALIAAMKALPKETLTEILTSAAQEAGEAPAEQEAPAQVGGGDDQNPFG